MASDSQHLVARTLGEGAYNRLDYSGRQLTTVDRLPSSYEEGLKFIHRGNESGVGSPAHSDLMAAYQAGWDLNNLPSADGGGIPRSIEQTAAEIAHHSETARRYFSGPIDPVLHQLQMPDGRTLAQAGPEEASTRLALAMADAPPSLRPLIIQAQQAIQNATTTSLGIEWETPDEPMVWQAATEEPSDPSGYTQWREGQAGFAPGLQSLMLQAQHSDAMFDGISNTGGGGGTYDHYDAMMMAEVRSGNINSLYLDSSGMHQGEAGNVSQSDVISQQ